MLLQLFAAIVSFQLLYTFFFDGYYRSQIPSSRGNTTFCPSVSCGEVKEISYPFALEGSKCPGFPLACQDNTTLLLNLTQYYDVLKLPRPRFLGIYHVKKINWRWDFDSSEENWIQIADPNFPSNNSASSVCQLPPYPIGQVMRQYSSWWERNSSGMVTWVKCRKVRGERGLDPATYLSLPCSDNNNSSASAWHYYLRLYNERNPMTVEQLDRSCHAVAYMPILYDEGDTEGLNLTAGRIFGLLQMGFRMTTELCDFRVDGYKPCPLNPPREVRWTPIDFGKMAWRQLVFAGIIGIAVFGIVPRILGILFLAGLLIYKLKNKQLPSDNVEKLLQTCQHLMPRRYSYPEIKIITRHFREKLGQGGFGSVFKGSLFDHRPVAVKLLGNTKSGGQDFINEVSTIGRIHHVNVVRLLGFCSEGRTRALVYDFMPNGSLDKYICPDNNGRSHMLRLEMLYKIALGIAHGIEYLHRGCDMCILHFDIKPHNVLLDKNFCPKISDFGLAKLSLSQNITTLTGYRGTIGYIAPEQVSRHFGRVSSKSDVYSFGMLLLQMAGGRAKNRDVLAPSSSKFYLPAWIYDQMNEGRDVEIDEATEIELEMVKKLALVGLCCIQMMPANRPSMSQVIEMLEGRLDTPQLPPKPFFMFPDAMSNEECPALSICQNEMEEVSPLWGTKTSTSSNFSGI